MRNGFSNRAARVVRSPFSRAVLLLASSTASVQAISVLTMPIKSRLYSPDDYGTVAVFHACAYILGLAGSLRYPNALPLIGDQREAVDALWTSSSALGVVGLIAAAVLGITVGTGHGEIFFPALRPWLWLFPIAVLANGLYEILFYWALREKAYRSIAQTRVSQAVVGNTAIISLGWLFEGPLGLVVGMLLSQSSGISLLLRAPIRALRRQWRAPNFRNCAAVARQYRRFPAYGLPSYLLTALGTTFTPVAVASCYGTRVGGCFSMAQSLMLLPVSLAGTAVSQVFFAEAAGSNRQGGADLRHYASRIVSRLVPIVVLLILAGLIAPTLLPVVLGARWNQAGVFALYLSFPAGTQLLVLSVSALPVLKNRLGVQLIFDSLRAAVLIGAFVVSSAIGVGASSAVVAYCALTTCVNLACLVVYWRMAAESGAAATVPDVAPAAEYGDWSGDITQS